MRSYPLSGSFGNFYCRRQSMRSAVRSSRLNGTPIVTFDSSSDYPGISAFVSTDNSASATEAANRLTEAMGESGESCFYAGLEIAGSPDKENAFVSQIQSTYPNITIVETYHMDQIDTTKTR